MSISQGGLNILVDVNTVAGKKFTKMLLWNSTTYKVEAKAVDLTSLLAGTSENEILSISITDAGVSKFSGMYFIEFTTDEASLNTHTGLVANFVKYHECLMDKALQIEVENCSVIKSECGRDNDLLFITALIESLNTAVIFSLIEEAIAMEDTLNQLCGECTLCPDLGDDALLLSGMGFKTVNNQVISI